MTKYAYVIALAAMVVSAACGGGSNGPTNPTSPPETLPTPPAYNFIVSILGTEAPGKMSGDFVQLKVSGMIEARLDWTPTDAQVELYITTSIRSGFPMTCPMDAPCTGFLAADTDPVKRPKKAVTGVLAANEYTVLVRNRDSRVVDLHGEIGWYAVAASGGGVSAKAISPTWEHIQGTLDPAAAVH